MKNRCTHSNCSDEEQVWLPMGQQNKELKKYSYCKNCGMIKNTQEPYAKTLGYYVNVLMNIRNYLDCENKKNGIMIAKLTVVQIRLIVKDLKAIEDFDDTYFRNKFSQNEIFLDVLEKHLSGMKREHLKNFLN